MSTSGDRRKDPKKEGDTTGAVNHPILFAFVSSSKPKLISLTIRLSFSAAAFQLPIKKSEDKQGKQVDEAFWDKYHAVRASRELDVQSCYRK